MRVCLISAVLLTALTATSASATTIISDDIGGKMRDYTTRFRQVRDSGEPVVISGTCVSACTMVLGLVPSDRIAPPLMRCLDSMQHGCSTTPANASSAHPGRKICWRPIQLLCALGSHGTAG